MSLCPNCGHKAGSPLPEMRPMGMLPYLLNATEKKILLLLASKPDEVFRKGELGRFLRRRYESPLMQRGLVEVMPRQMVKITAKGIVAAMRVKEWEEAKNKPEREYRVPSRKKPTRLAGAILARQTKRPTEVHA